MQILLSNDDGYRAEGILCLREHLSEIAQICVVAPDRNRSAASNSLTITMPLRMRKEEEDLYVVDGTPTDCVHLATTGSLHVMPDMVVSGINAGENLGDDVLYSGTVAAAMEGRFLGFPALAVSSLGDFPEHYETAARVTKLIIQKIGHDPLPPDTILNINVPDVPWEQLKGLQVTRLGNRHKSEPVIRSQDPKGKEIFWIGPSGSEADAGPGTDFHAVRNHYVSITPLHTDLTRYQAMADLTSWTEDLF